MSEYIDREKLIEALKVWQKTLIETYGKNDEYVRCLESVLIGIDNIPAADMRPVKRGHKVTHNRPIAGYWASGKLDGGWDGMEGRVWVEPIDDNPVDYCSECGKRLDDTFQNYCPNCGAEMKEDV